MPLAHKQSGNALQEFHCPLSTGSVAVNRRSSNPPQGMAVRCWSSTAPLPPGSVAGHCGSCTTHRPQAVWRCITGVPLPRVPRQCGSALKECHCPLPLGSVAVHCRCPQAAWRCITRVPLPPAPTQYGGKLLEFHSPLLAGSVGVHCGSSTIHYPQAVGGASK